MTVDRHGPENGFTLVEVLVALAIIAFGLVAVFSQLSQSATAAARLREKTLAHWVAVDRLTELRLSGAFPGEGVSSDEIEMANTRWRYEVKVSATDTDDLRRADVSVAYADSPDRPLATVTGFLAERRAITGLNQSGWSVIDPNAGAPGEAQPEEKQEPDAQNDVPNGASQDPDANNNQGSADQPGEAQPQ